MRRTGSPGKKWEIYQDNSNVKRRDHCEFTGQRCNGEFCLYSYCQLKTFGFRSNY